MTSSVIWLQRNILCYYYMNGLFILGLRLTRIEMPCWLKGSSADIDNIIRVMTDSQVLCEDSPAFQFTKGLAAMSVLCLPGTWFFYFILKNTLWKSFTVNIYGFLRYCSNLQDNLHYSGYSNYAPELRSFLHIGQQPASVIMILLKVRFRLFKQVHA